jgi:phosphate transport system ATP-binding protein
MTESQDRHRTEDHEPRGLRQPLEIRSLEGDSAVPALEGVPEAKRRPHEAIFSLEDVMVSYSQKPAVRGVSFDIGKNEITALIGPSGCGKSTLIRVLNR